MLIKNVLEVDTSLFIFLFRHYCTIYLCKSNGVDSMKNI